MQLWQTDFSNPVANFFVTCTWFIGLNTKGFEGTQPFDIGQLSQTPKLLNRILWSLLRGLLRAEGLQRACTTWAKQNNRWRVQRVQINRDKVGILLLCGLSAAIKLVDTIKCLKWVQITKEIVCWIWINRDKIVTSDHNLNFYST